MNEARLIALLAGALAAGGPAGAATYYVDAACGDDQWQGTSPVCAAPDGPVATIQAAIDRASGGDEIVVADGVYAGPGNRDLVFNGLQLVLRSAGGAAGCTIDCAGAGRAFDVINGDDVEIQGFTVINGWGIQGGAARILNASASFRDCVFENNSAEVSGAIWHGIGTGTTVLEGCVFDGNQVIYGAGAVYLGGDAGVAVGCTFTDNDGGQGPGALGGDAGALEVVNCLFARNTAEFLGGGVADASGTAQFVNCVFSRNEASMGGAMELGSPNCTIVNCTFSGNEHEGIGGYSPVLRNCILWGNLPVQIAGSVAVEHSDVQGGWPGPGNIDADPLFVQPGTDDVRLAFGSPCVDLGDNGALPPDDLDLDGDGDTSEPIPVDLDGDPRVQGGVVDLGASEGEHEAEAPAAGDEDLDQGELAILVPEGGVFDPRVSPAVLVMNTSGPDNASFLVTQYDSGMHAGAGGFDEVGAVLSLETDLADGQFAAIVYIPIDAAFLGGADPLHADPTCYDPAAESWAYAPVANTVSSPGFEGPIGDRITSTNPEAWGVTLDPGDYGVFWDPAQQHGFVWANVDHVSDFGAGIALCPADCRQTPDGVIGIQDFLTLLVRWGTTGGGGPCDTNYDGVIDQVDLGALLGTWGPCGVETSASPPRSGAVVQDWLHQLGSHD